ncbi:MAG TPA: S-adenosylmethionine:tRNA ribosyltransferase-isomerase [Chitinophagaceae bacterium]|nr:S-adenosylmethionine:tRNA ribosyltransferase-isomerase [Chitinophagaceae bacterium]
MDPRNININDFTYLLPDERIARFPLPERDASRLLVYDRGQISEDIYRNIANHIPEETTLVFNDTRVVEARLLFTKPTGGVIEIFALEPADIYPEIQTAMHQKGEVIWKCMIGGASKWKRGMILEKKIGTTLILSAAIVEHLPDSFLVKLSWNDPELSFGEVLHLAGLIPLPPYLKRESEESDKERYQTIYAKTEGSVAAPTAGLHFTDRVFESLRAKQIQPLYVTLHVGAGTFKPVKTDRLEEHDMHSEFIDVTDMAVAHLAESKRVYAVGTTSLRTLETLYWMGIKCSLNPGISMEELEMQQWEVYDRLNAQRKPAKDALRHLLTWMHSRNMKRIVCRTRLLVTPGYRPGLVRGLITNFHQPQSTLLLLVAALMGDDWKKMYTYALDHDYRFLSYGDGCIIKT